MKRQQLNIDSTVFDRLRYFLSEKIEEVVLEMMGKNMPEASVTAKIKIGLVEHIDENGEVERVVIFDPKVTGKIGKTTEQKVGGSGGKIAIGEDGRVEVWNEQITMDELQKEGA